MSDIVGDKLFPALPDDFEPVLQTASVIVDASVGARDDFRDATYSLGE